MAVLIEIMNERDRRIITFDNDADNGFDIDIEAAQDVEPEVHPYRSDAGSAGRYRTPEDIYAGYTPYSREGRRDSRYTQPTQVQQQHERAGSGMPEYTRPTYNGENRASGSYQASAGYQGSADARSAGSYQGAAGAQSSGSYQGPAQAQSGGGSHGGGGNTQPPKAKPPKAPKPPKQKRYQFGSRCRHWSVLC